MNRLLHYLNDTLESLDMPPLTKHETKKVKKETRQRSKKITLKEIK